MAYNEYLADRVRDALRKTPNVEEKKMFGGLAFMVNDKMCVTICNDRMMFRVDPELHEELLQSRPCKTAIMAGREYKGYLHVESIDLEDGENFEYWVSLALDFNERAKSSKG